MAEHIEPIIWDEEHGFAIELGHEDHDIGRSPSSRLPRNDHAYSAFGQPPAVPPKHKSYSKQEQPARQPAVDVYACCKCSRTFDAVSSLRHHMETRHLAPESSTCEGCKQQYSVHIGRTRVERVEQQQHNTSPAQGYVCGHKGTVRSRYRHPRWGCARLFEQETALYEHFQSWQGQACIAPLWSEGEERQASTQKTQASSSSALTMASSIDESGSGSISIAMLPAKLVSRYPNLRNWMHSKNTNDEKSLSGRRLTNRYKKENTEHELTARIVDITAGAGDHLTEDIIRSQQNNSEADLPQFLETLAKIQDCKIQNQEKAVTSPPRRSDKAVVRSTFRLRQTRTGSPAIHEVSQQPEHKDFPDNKPVMVEGEDSREDATIQQRSSLQEEGKLQKLSPVSSHNSGNYNSNSESELSFIGAIWSDTDIVQIDDLDLNAWSVVNELAESAVKEYRKRYGRNGPRTCTGEQCVNVDTNVKTTVGRASETAKSKATKRAYQERDRNDSENDRDEDNNAPTSKRTKDVDGEPMRLFACPYAKFDPQRYSEQNQTEKKYRKCSSIYLKDVTRVKQHLCRTHKRPDWYCATCYQHFESREELNAHVKCRSCDEQPAKYEEMMTDTQHTQVKRRSQEKSDRESWYKVYETLFPGASKPLSPYVLSSDPAVVRHFLNFFQWFGPQRFLDVVRTHRERNTDFLLEASTQAVIDEALEVALPNHLEQSSSVSESEEHLENNTARVDERVSSNIQPLVPPYGEYEPDLYYSYQANDALDDTAGLGAEMRNLGPANQYQMASHGHSNSAQISQYLNRRAVNIRELHPQEFQPYILQPNQTFGMYNTLEGFSGYDLSGTYTDYPATHTSNFP